MSQTALVEALTAFDIERVRALLAKSPALETLRPDNGIDLLQCCCTRFTGHDRAAAARQVRLAKWLVSRGFDPRALHTTAPGEDGEEAPATVSLVWFAVAKAQNNRLARYFLERGAAPGALFAAAWWGNADIVDDLVRHGADLNEMAGGTPLHMAVDVARRGADGKPEVARRRLRCLKEMLRLGANPDVQSPDGTTPLHIALKKEYADVFALLLKHGASPDVPGRDGRTVRDIASRKKDARYADLLRAAGGAAGQT